MSYDLRSALGHEKLSRSQIFLASRHFLLSDDKPKRATSCVPMTSAQTSPLSIIIKVSQLPRLLVACQH